jgi:molecular chaperone GrpE
MMDDVESRGLQELTEGGQGGPAEGESPAPSGTGQTGREGGTAADELSRLQQEVDRHRELYLRKLADFENYRKRQEREMADFRRFANSELIRDCLPVLDNLERALQASGPDTVGIRTGVELVLKQFKDVLGKYGLIEIDPGGEQFDPSLHEAIQRVETFEVEDNTVLQVALKGYLLGEKLVRPAMVVVAIQPHPEGVDEIEFLNGDDA